jgi:hypothetical protein
MLDRILATVVEVKPGERRALFWSFAYFFLILSAYYVLRPLRDNAGITGGGNVTVALKPGIVNTVPVTKKPFVGDAPRVSIRNFRVKIDGCVGESFIRSYAILARSTDERETVLSWYGATKAV